MASNKEVQLFDGAVQQLASTNGAALRLTGRDSNFVAVMTASSVNGATTLDVKIQHSRDGSLWFDLAGGGFTQLVGVNGDEHLQITANVMKFSRGVTVLAGATQEANVELNLVFDDNKDD